MSPCDSTLYKDEAGSTLRIRTQTKNIFLSSDKIIKNFCKEARRNNTSGNLARIQKNDERKKLEY